MINRRKNIRNNKIKWSIYLPIITLFIISVITIFSSSYRKHWFYNWENIRPQIRDTVKSIQEYGSISSGVVGINAEKPKQWNRRFWLMNNANDYELFKLTDYPNGTVKAVAYESLIRRGNKKMYETLIKAMNDTSTFFNFQSGCEGETMMIGEYLIERVINLKDPLPEYKRKISMKLSEGQIVEILDLYEKRKSKKWFYHKNYHDWKD